ncbi:MAG: hypothetical protein QF718_06330 [Phycisphaerales bacterium]|jgi:hypothetical protein|nr:hypothetical protein [Phycisphaerales bacterium]
MQLFHFKYQLYLFAVICGISFGGCEAPQEIQNKPPSPKQPTSTNQESKVTENSLVQQNQLLENEQLKQRLITAYATHWPLIPTEYQHELLPEVLGDPIPALKVFGIERVGVLLRDGEATEEELQLVVDLLRNQNHIVRLAVAKLLPEINVLGLQEYVAKSLSFETNQQVASLELDFFRTQPHPSALRTTIERLSSGPVEPAAKALIVLLDTNMVTRKTANSIVQTVQQSRLLNDMPSLITLEAMLGDSDVQHNLIPLLHNSNEDIRIATAQGFSTAGYAEPLIELTDDPVMYSYALSALQKRGGIEGFKELIKLYKPETPKWNTAAFTISNSLDTTSLLRADDMLKRLELHDLRLSILQSIWEKQNRDIPDKRGIATRTVSLMIKMGNAVGALQLLDTFDEALIDEDLLSLRFTAAIAASAWDEAEDARPEPLAWIAAWEKIKDNDLTVAAVIHQQIVQRFKEQLTESQRELLGINQPKDSNQTP